MQDKVKHIIQILVCILAVMFTGYIVVGLLYLFSLSPQVGVLHKLDQMKKDIDGLRGGILTVTTGLNSGYYEATNKNGEAIVRTFSGDITGVYKDGKVWLFSGEGADSGVRYEDGLTTIGLVEELLNSKDLEYQEPQEGRGNISYILVTNKIPTSDKLLTEFISKNIKDCSGIRLIMDYVDAEIPSFKQATIELESSSGDRTLYCSFSKSGIQTQEDWELDKMWGEQTGETISHSAVALKNKELSKLQERIMQAVHNRKQIIDIKGSEYIKASTQKKQEYIDDVLRELGQAESVLFTGDRVGLVKEVDEYYATNGSTQGLSEVIEYICFTEDLLAPYRYASEEQLSEAVSE